MAMQTGMGVTKIIILAGAGTILLKNTKLSEILGELESLIRGSKSSGNPSDADSAASEAIAAQVRRLAMEVRQISARPITVLNGSSQNGNMTSLIVPAAALGALGYGYMWWKGISFSDLMYVTKQNMANAVSNLTKHLEHVSDVLAATKKHLTQRIENLDGKMDEQVEISKLIRNEVTDVRGDLSQIGFDLSALQATVSGLDGKIGSLEYKQDVTNLGVWFLCNFAEGKKVKMPEVLQEQLKLPGKSRSYLPSSETPSLMGLKEIADSIVSGNADRSVRDGVMQDGIDGPRRSLTRIGSNKC